MEVINQVFKPNLTQKRKRVRVYKILARSKLTYVTEAYRICK
jgi:hypothetical protein